jgi:hypothetical protein
LIASGGGACYARSSHVLDLLPMETSMPRFAFVACSVVLCSFAVACGGSESNNNPGGNDTGTIDETGGDTGTIDNDTGAPPDDTGPEVDNGAPSTDYPAKHPPFPQLVNQAGNLVLDTPKAFLVFYPGYTFETQLTEFAKTLGTQSYWSDATSEYGVGPITYVDQRELTGETAPATISSTEIEAFVSTKLKSGAWGTPDPKTIYTIFYPSTTSITMAGGPFGTSKSCSSFGGYHSDVNVTIGPTTSNYAFAVLPTCAKFGALTGIDAVTGALSHEWAEASTDPYPSTNGGADSTYSSVDTDHFIWELLGGAEDGDLCAQRPEAFFKPSGFSYTVQACWSNKAAKAGGDPCAPHPAGVYFNAAPVLPDHVTLDLSALGGGSVRTLGVKIPSGGSATIEVDLFSDGDTGGAFAVAAVDAIAQFTGGKPTLGFAWDRTTGLNGEKLHLTLTVLGASPFGKAHPFILVAHKGARVEEWPSLASE